MTTAPYASMTTWSARALAEGDVPGLVSLYRVASATLVFEILLWSLELAVD
jgi:hypothetical protein